MKKRVSNILNFVAFNLLFFALYLNFIHKDGNVQAPISQKQSTVTMQEAVLVENPEQYLKEAKPSTAADMQKLAIN